MPEFDVDPDIRRAHTLPSRFYTDPQLFEAAKEKVFARSWQFVDWRSGSENLLPITLLPDFLDEPLLLSSDSIETKCLSNVCTHRGKILVEMPCNADLIRCGYHARRFSLDGTFLSMPEFGEVENFPSASDNLREIPSARWLNFSFVSLDPTHRFDQLVSEFSERFVDIDARSLLLQKTTEYNIAAHWALYCENYLEGFHIPYVHKSLNEIVDYGTYSTETFRFASLQTGYDAHGARAGRYLFIFPNTMLNFYPWGVS
ncbi:MAG: Rieske 2Fe-2S domain-containing protein, partial [Acidobacteria bacterium]|nr:Rieske 2Fe-2S domain-containing protein [Acidobacteriota bacterium]